jgi:protocatechuate 3,4-dioxygenase beta subunit
MRPANFLISPLVLILGLSCLVAQSTDNPRNSEIKKSVTGRVIARGKPLAGALITIWRQTLAEPTQHNGATTTRTDSAGNYELTDIPAGNYFITATAPGFVTGKENQVFANLRPVTVIADHTADQINFELLPEGVITGTITDADNKPVARISITIFPEGLSPADAQPPPYARDIYTDDQGFFRVSGVPAGRYRLAAGNQAVVSSTFFGRTGYTRTFYPEAADEAHANLIEIAAGTEVNDVNINVGKRIKTFAIRARIVDAQNGQPITGIDYGLSAYSNGKRIGGVGNSNRSDSRGEITIENVPPGEYSIRVPSGRTFLAGGEVAPVPNLLGESKHFEVTDSDVGTIEVQVFKGATVSGLVAIEGAADIDTLARMTQMRLMAMIESKPGTLSPIMMSSIKPDGSFVITGLKPGKLRFSFYPPAVGNPLPIRSLRTERDGVKLDRDLEIESGDQITGLRLVLVYANGSIQGQIKFTNGSLPSGAKLIARAFDGKDLPPLGYATVDGQGRFLLQNLPAGEYRLVIGIMESTAPPLAEQKVIVSDNGTTDLVVQVDLGLRATPK